MNEWSDRIKELEASGKTLSEIADLIGLHISSVSDLKRGASKAPTGMAAVRLFQLHKRTMAAAKRRQRVA